MNTKKLTFCAIMITLATVLNFLSGLIPLFRMPQGGSVVLMSTMIIMLIGVKYGYKTGLLVGFIYGILNFLMLPYLMHPMALMLDYFLAFMVFGLGTLFIGKNVTMPKIFIAYFICSVLRFICHFTSGVIFYYEYAAEVGQTVYYYSFVYNITYIIPEYILNVVLISIPSFKNIIFQNFINER